MQRFLNFLSGERLDHNSPPPLLLQVRSSKIFILITICIAVFTDIFLYAIIVPVLPFSLTERAGIPPAELQKWVAVLLAVYGGALCLGSPVIGWYADRSSSRRWPLLLGLLFLGGSTVMLCLSRHIALLVLGRLLQGFAASVVWTVGLALLVDTVGPAEIGQMLGWVSLSMTIGVLAGPLLGGVVYDEAGYYPVFYMAFGLIALDILLRLLLIEKKIALQWLEEAPPSNPQPISNEAEHSHGASPILEDTSPPPPAPSKYPAVISLLSSARLLAALYACLVQGSLVTAFDSVVPLFVQHTFGWGPTAAGLSFLALVVPTFAAPLMGWLSDNYGPRWFTVFGFILAIPFWVLLRLVTHNSTGQKLLFFALLALIGLALIMALTPVTAEIAYIVDSKEREIPGRYGANGAYAQAYGLYITAFAAGNVVGPLWGGYVEDAAGWGTMTWSLALFSATGAVPCLIWTGGFITKRNAKDTQVREPGGAALGLVDNDKSDNSV